MRESKINRTRRTTEESIEHRAREKTTELQRNTTKRGQSKEHRERERESKREHSREKVSHPEISFQTAFCPVQLLGKGTQLDHQLQGGEVHGLSVGGEERAGDNLQDERVSEEEEEEEEERNAPCLAMRQIAYVSPWESPVRRR